MTVARPLAGGSSDGNRGRLAGGLSSDMAEDRSVHIDPVCKMEVREGTEAGKWRYQGTDYYFCNPNCLRRFRDSPERFLNTTEAEAMQMSNSGPGKSETCSIDIGGMSCAGCALRGFRGRNKGLWEKPASSTMKCNTWEKLGGTCATSHRMAPARTQSPHSRLMSMPDFGAAAA